MFITRSSKLKNAHRIVIIILATFKDLSGCPFGTVFVTILTELEQHN